jgi:hypothetical protein
MGFVHRSPGFLGFLMGLLEVIGDATSLRLKCKMARWTRRYPLRDWIMCWYLPGHEKGRRRWLSGIEWCIDGAKPWHCSLWHGLSQQTFLSKVKSSAVYCMIVEASSNR